MSAYSDRILSLAPLAYYRLGESSGVNAADSSGNGRNGTYSGSPALGTDGAISDGNRALRTDGVDDFVVLPSSLAPNIGSSITIEWWQYIATADVKACAAFTIGNFDDPNRCMAHAPYSDGVLYWDYGNTGLGMRVSTSYTSYLDKWTHVCLTYDAATHKRAITLNGVEVASSTATTTPAGGVLNVGYISHGPGGGTPAKGLVDEFAVYGYALSPSDRLANYNTRWADSPYAQKVINDGPLFYWRLGESAGTTAVDQKGALSGTYTASPTLGVAGLLTGSGDTDTAMQTFGAAGQGVSIADVPAHRLTTLTLEAWVKTSAPLGGYRAVVSKQFSFGIFLVDGVFAVFDWVSSVTTSSGVNVADGQRHHLVAALSATAGGSRLYLDGQPVGAAFAYTATPQAGTLLIGTNPSQDIAAVIDEVAVYPTVLTPAQILAHYNAGTTSAGPAQTVIVPSVWPVGSVVSIVGQVVVSDGHLVGGKAGALFGVPTIVGAAPATQVGGVPSAQQFGTPTFRIGVPATVTVGGVPTAQQFGALTFFFPPQVRAVGAVPSAALFGTPTSRLFRPVGGVPSAASFGVPKTAQAPYATGIPSAQQFGVAKALPGPVFRTVAGIPSAQLFGKAVAHRYDLHVICKPEGGLTMPPSTTGGFVLNPVTGSTLVLNPVPDTGFVLTPITEGGFVLTPVDEDG